MKWWDAMRAGKESGKEPRGSDCYLDVIGGSPKRGVWGWRDAMGTGGKHTGGDAPVLAVASRADDVGK